MNGDSTEGEELKVGPVAIRNITLYRDGLQPTVQELGDILWVPAALVNRALDPLKGVIWGWDQIIDYLRVEVGRRLQHSPPENVITPDLRLAGPTIEALRFSGDTPEIANMFATLLATTMNKETAEKAHPAFVEVIKQLTPDEAKIIKLIEEHVEFAVLTLYIQPETDSSSYIHRRYSTIGLDANCSHADMTPAYLDNLCRLGVTEYPQASHTSTGKKSPVHEQIESETTLLEDKRKYEESGKKVSIGNSIISLTQFGVQFCEACLGAPNVTDAVQRS